MEDKARDAVSKVVQPASASTLTQWAESPFPPMALATLIAGQNLQPFRIIPMLFPVALLGSTYMNLADAKVDAAGTSAAWSGLYALMAGRRHQALRNKWGLRGGLRGITILGCLGQAGAGGWYYATHRRTT